MSKLDELKQLEEAGWVITGNTLYPTGFDVELTNGKTGEKKLFHSNEPECLRYVSKKLETPPTF